MNVHSVAFAQKFHMHISAALPLPAADSRIAEILGLVRKAFVEKGFDGASMQDLARSAGMSVGNFYRYFPSKDAIVEALVAWDMDEIDQEFARILQAPDPMSMLRQVLAEHVMDNSCDDDGALWTEICAAAKRKPRIAEVSARMEGAIVDRLVSVFQMASQNADPVRRQVFVTEARMLVLLVKASKMQSLDLDDGDTELKLRVLRSIDDILNSLFED
jgi:AcrR family transcriptional regulator